MRLKLALNLSACRQAKSPNEIENASRVGRECARPDWIRRFIRGFAEDAKFEENQEVIIDPAVDAGFGETRRRRDGKSGGCGNRGNSVTHQSEPRERDSGKLETLNPRQSRKVKDAGQPVANTGRRSRTSNAVGKPAASAPEAPKDASAWRDGFRPASQEESPVSTGQHAG